MRTKLIAILVLLLISNSVFCNVLLQNPRGNNNKCDEQSSTVSNARRLFNSQNYNNAGYCINTEPMYYYEGSILNVQWRTLSDSNSPKIHSTYVLQYACEDTLTVDTSDGSVRDGIPAPNPENGNGNQCTPTITTTDATNVNLGRNEALTYFDNCNIRERNSGLATFDQILLGNSAQFTRQNPGGTTYGFECQEERDYYPYWQPSPWRDIAILTDRLSLCSIFQTQSQNVQTKNYCSNQIYNNNNSCVTNGGTWLTQPSFNTSAPDCIIAPTADQSTPSLLSYPWTIPSTYGNTCVFRIRANFSSDDYNDWDTFSSNDNILTSFPLFALNASDPDGASVELAINTLNFGTVYQDRSFVFKILPRPSSIPSNANIYNLNVIGSRGNFFQIFPNVFYDFSPDDLTVNLGDYIHFQWTGCDRNNPNFIGTGFDRTDRSNVCQLSSLLLNTPLSLQNQTLFDTSSLAQLACLLIQNNCAAPLPLRTLLGMPAAEQAVNNCAVINGVLKPINVTTGYPNNGDQTGTGESYTAYFDLGPIQMNRTGTFYYMSSRNNRFSVIQTKGTISVVIPVQSSTHVSYGISFKRKTSLATFYTTIIFIVITHYINL